MHKITIKMTTNPIKENLNRSYQEFIDKTDLPEFITGLNFYLDHVLSQPTLKSIVDDVMDEKKRILDKINELENESLEELISAKKYLLKVISDNDIDPESFPRHWLRFMDEVRTAIMQISGYSPFAIVRNW